MITSANITPEELVNMRKFAAVAVAHNTKGSGNLGLILGHTGLKTTREEIEKVGGSSIGYVDRLRSCNPRSGLTQRNNILLVDGKVEDAIWDAKVPRVCYEECIFGSMRHLGVTGGRRRIACPEHIRGVQFVLENVKNNEGDLRENVRIERFLRAPDYDYLARILGVDLEYLEGSGIWELYHFDERDTQYVNAARNSTKFLHSNLFNSLDDIVKFSELLAEYSIISRYGQVDVFMRYDGHYSNPRLLKIPECLAGPLLALSNGEVLTSSPWNSTMRIHSLIDQVFDDTGKVFDVNEHENTRFSNAVHALYVMERSWTWFGGNHSRCMNYFNVLLEVIGINPIPHGVIDFAAHLLDFESFKKYIDYVMSIKE